MSTSPSHLQILFVPLPINVSFGAFHQIFLPRALQFCLDRERAMAMRLTCSLCMALCHALLFAYIPLSARNAFTMIFTSSADLPETLAALFPWLWAEPSTLALCTGFD